uniref:Amino acid transporter transmembrane domain-containing protein n=1 Tax=Electrophorus electricus TaxID=8005 RepID=A0A4W4DWC3_ELEEL
MDEEDEESQKFLTHGMMKKKFEEYHEEYHPGHASFGMSVFNLSNAIMGSGILGLSFAMANTGIVLFLVLLLGVSILSLYSIHLLLVTAKEGGSLIYEKLGERAFGWPGKITAFGSIILQNIGAMSSYLFIVKYELPEVIRTFLGLEENSGEWYLNGNYLVVFVSVGIILPLSLLKNLGYLGYTSGFSLSCMVFFVGVVSVPLCVVNELKDRSQKKMQNVSNLSILAMVIMYMLSALFGYLTFYDNVEAELLHTFIKVYKFDTMLLMVRLAVLTSVTLTVPIVLFPIRSSITTLLFAGREFSWFRHILIAAAILAFNNLLVIFVPTIRDIFGFIGES